MGLLSGLISTATNAVGTNENAQANAAKSNMASTLQRAQLQRQDQQDQIAQALQAREAQSQAYKDQLVQSQIGDTNQQMRIRQHEADHPPQSFEPVTAADGSGNNVVYRFNKKTGQMEPTGVSGKIPTPPRDPVPHFSVTPITLPDGTVHVARVNTLTGEVSDTGQMGKQVAPKQLSASQQKAIATNVTSVSTIDKALKNLKTHPDATGLTRGRSDYADQFLDPEGVDTRALIANVGSQIVHDRSGAAVTVSEYPRLAPFIPSVHDRPEAIKKKLKLLREAIATETSALGGEVPAELPDDDDVATANATPTRNPTPAGGGHSLTPQQAARIAAIKAKHGLP